MGITFHTTATDGPELDMSNSNALAVLQLLGIHADAADLAPAGWPGPLLVVAADGTMPAEDFLGRVLVAQGLLDISTDDEHGQLGVDEGRWIDCGRRPGYLAEKLAALHTIATWARQAGADIIWS